ncbi:class I SAM-dependent methyltransferase [Corynebacterium sp. UBA2622]|uniref:class I SAM-dependent methyltransferase n=1 Tax=Corynebacterium sp. UBA2622 TaxID=1946393 RepID=UPI0025B7DD32|nr:class I SAM-dependent methyltransferase [Corynebacterium sp. UBA2622]
MSTPSQANRSHWDADAGRYHAEHASYLEGFHWSPEMVAERDVRLLGNVSHAAVLEIGCGSAPCASWLADDGAGFVAGFDISRGMLSRARRNVALVQADALAIPFRDGAFDAAFSAFGAIPFVRDIDVLLAEVSRVLAPGGRFVFSVNHPMRWVFPDDPEAFTAEIPYFSRAYEERDKAGTLTYAEYHRTFGDYVRAFNATGFELVDLLEPEWPADLKQRWGQWSPERGAIFPGTAIFVTRRRGA